MQPKSYHKIIRWVGIVAVLAAVFVAGAYAGTNKSVAQVIAPAKTAAVATDPSADLSQFWYVWNLMDRKYPFKTEVPDTKEKLYGAIEGLVHSYGDPYTVFFPPKEAKLFNDQVKGSFGGVGMEIGIKDDALTVIAPIKNSPADHAGIKSGDYIAEIDGKKTDSMDLDTAISQIRGDVGTTVTLGIYRIGVPEMKNYSIVRDIVNLPILDTKVEGNVFIISLYSFSEDSPRLFRQALEKFSASNTDHLIIDLRNNPGGYLDAAVDIASYFLPKGATVVREHGGTDEAEIIHQSKGYAEISKKVKIAVLINGGSASASEILAGALSEHGAAKLIGATTFGKGSVQELIDLPDSSSIKITVAKWFTPKGVSISDKGITPDIAVKDEAIKDPKTGQYRDLQMEAALKWLR